MQTDDAQKAIKQLEDVINDNDGVWPTDALYELLDALKEGVIAE